ncbi:uncharacterized protein LOC111323186 [Stylophora pistillata]|nr:uncharacterized protein LOC111323186 [Stylophora pistillata]
MPAKQRSGDDMRTGYERGLILSCCRGTPQRNLTETVDAKMADGRDELSFLPNVKASACKQEKKTKRVGLKNLQRPLVLPSLELSTVDLQLVSSLFSHKQICKKVCEWFTDWRSWQQRILLCGVSEKCTKGQLQAFVTTLEPVFHRDFTTRLKGIYPTARIQARLVHTGPAPSFSAEELKNALQPSQEVDRVNSLTTVGEEDKLKDKDVDSFQSESGGFHDQNSSMNLTADHRTVGIPEGSVDSPHSPDGGTALTATTHSIKPAAGMEENHRHEHAPPFIRRVSTPNFFPHFNHKQLGHMRTTPKTGDKNKLYGHAPVTFKHDKWWKGYKGGHLIKPRRSKLSNHFKSQLSQIHQWLDEWPTYKRLELLSEVVKCCDEESLNFFAQCLTQRLRDTTDLNCVPDNVLLYVFSFLNVRSLCQSSQVCYRWRFLTNDSRLWKAKIASLGASEGISNLTEKIEVLGHGHAVDWKQAYREVQNYYKDLASVKLEEEDEEEFKEKLEAAGQEEKKQSRVTELPPEPIDKDELKKVQSDVAELLISQMMEDIGPAQSAPAADQKEHGDEFAAAADFDGNDLTGGNLKLLTRSLKALAQDGGEKSEDLEVALDVRPILVQASNLLESDGERGRHKFRYLSLAVQGVLAVRRVRRLQGHMDAILCLQFDKTRIITGSADRTIRVWDVRSGRGIHKLKGHKGGVRCLQFDDEKIISGSWDMTIMVWHIVKFHRLKVLYGHSGCVSSLQFNGKILVSGSHDRTLRIWSTDTWECESVIEGHEGAVTCLQLNGDYLVSGSTDRTLKLWDIKTRECLHTLEGHRDAVLAATVLGKLVISGSADGMIMFWNLETGNCEAAIQGHEGPVHSLDYNGHQHFFSSGGDHLLKEWDVSTCTCLRSLQGHKGPVFCVKAAPHRVVSCSADGFARIWDLVSLPEGKGQSKAIAFQGNVITPTRVEENSL